MPRSQLCRITNVHLPCCICETSDAHLDGFLVHWIHSHRRATVDILVASRLCHTRNQDAELRGPGDLRARSASRQDPEVASQEVAQVLAGIRGPSPLFDGDSIDIELMKILHVSRVDSTLDEIYAPTMPVSVDLAAPEVQDAEPQRPQRWMGYFDLHPV